MLFTEGVRLLQKSILTTALAKYFLLLVLVQQICAKSSFEGYVEAYHAESEDNYKDAFEVVSDISTVNKIEQRHHEKKGLGHIIKKKDLGHTKKELGHEEKDLGQDYDDDYEYNECEYNCITNDITINLITMNHVEVIYERAANTATRINMNTQTLDSSTETY